MVYIDSDITRFISNECRKFLRWLVINLETVSWYIFQYTNSYADLVTNWFKKCTLTCYSYFLECQLFMLFRYICLVLKQPSHINS